MNTSVHLCHVIFFVPGKFCVIFDLPSREKKIALKKKNCEYLLTTPNTLQ